MFSIFLALGFSVDYYCSIALSSVIVESNTKLLCNSSEITINRGSTIYVVGESSSNTITSINSDISAILLNTKITSSKSTFEINGGNVEISVIGESSLESTNDAGILCHNDAIITFTGEKNNKLSITSSLYAGIGGGESSTKCKAININGKATLISNGGYYGAGIGGGWGNVENTSNVGEINIYDGNIVATSLSSAGIGGGDGKSSHSSSVDIINIYGGIIKTTGGDWGAGIGGGYGFKDNSSHVQSIYISGGEIAATGGRNAAGIGAGAGLSHNSGNVDLLTLTANKQTQSQSVCLKITAIGGLRANGIGNGSGGKVSKIDEIGATSSCSYQTCTFESESNSCVSPWNCDVLNCLLCPSSTSICTACEDGYTLENGVCKLSIVPTITQTTLTASASSISQSVTLTQTTSHSTTQPLTQTHTITGTQEPTIYPTPQPGEYSAIIYCPSISDNMCLNISTHWDDYKKELIQKLETQLNLASTNQKYSYQHAIQSVKSINLIKSVNGEVDSALKEVKKDSNIIILQYGSVSSVSQAYNLTSIGKNEVEIICLTDLAKIVLRGGDLSNISVLTCIFSSHFSFVNEETVILNKLVLLSSSFIGNNHLNAIDVWADKESAPSCNLLSGAISNLMVYLPNKVPEIYIEYKVDSILVATPMSVKGLSTIIRDSSNDVVSTRIATNHTGVICNSSKLTLALDPTTETVNYITEIDFVPKNGQVSVVFDGDNWDNCNFTNDIVIVSDQTDDIQINDSKQHNIKIVGREDKKKLSGGAIAGIVIAVIVICALVSFLIVYFVCIKKKKETKEEGNEKNTGYKLLNSNENI
ncbi:hypothetical protein TRFO_28681 [Tritrichomonas foetus]|uniref:Uncharacterized protein n=1 Tax=Tritrichomonas foetus TaxID=1144522 RepID=A0A1J4K2I2_9EUKA|nr:hypothetical protein TRFO_28681 [Tritrichomonas foetus]|eukprot:OHT03956.1 hypothetical protein TRFO_28681 [Tritrichomonas foetus]